jgi:hypothetical protein
MSNEENAVRALATGEAAAKAPIAETATGAGPAAYEPIAAYEEPFAEDDWDQQSGELPPRPRRRLLGAGGNPIPLALLGVLLLACGFIGGVLVEKGQTTSTTGGSGAAGLASRFAALRSAGAGGSTTTGGGTGSSGAGASAAGAGGFAGRFGGLGGAGGATVGEVSYVSGNTLYVTSSEGSTVKVTTSAASAITKTVKSSVHGIHPGETVIVRGAKGSGGVVSAESVSVSTGASGSGLGALFGGGGGAGGRSAGAGNASGGAGGGGGPALFGN